MSLRVLLGVGLAYVSFGKRISSSVKVAQTVSSQREHQRPVAMSLLANNPDAAFSNFRADLKALRPSLTRNDERLQKSLLSRRDLMPLLGLGLLFSGASPARSFDNAIPEYSKYKDNRKRPGTQPKGLGVSKRTINEKSIDADPKSFQGLLECDGKTHCFSTTGDELLKDRIDYGVDCLIQPWKPPAGDAAPFKSLVTEVKAYKPGQGFVDGGGFQVVKETKDYIYLQFESLKTGYIDDVEFYFSDGKVQVRSSSRVGATDFGVNAKRLNYIAAGLRKNGWQIDEIAEKGYPDYFYAAQDAADQTFDPDRRKGTGLENERLERESFGSVSTRAQRAN